MTARDEPTRDTPESILARLLGVTSVPCVEAGCTEHLENWRGLDRFTWDGDDGLDIEPPKKKDTTEP